MPLAEYNRLRDAVARQPKDPAHPPVYGATLPENLVPLPLDLMQAPSGPAARVPVYLNRGQMGGVVLDMTGAVIPGAEVFVENKTAGSSYRAVTNAEGKWIVS